MRNLGISHLDVYVTGNCNYKCEYCYGEQDCRSDMTIQTYDKALMFAKYIGARNIQMCGGEPLVCKNFKEFTTLAKEAGFDVILRTNGYFLGDYLSFVAENFSWVGVSVDGVCDVNALMRPSKKAETAEEKFQRPIRAIRELKRVAPDLSVILATLASKQNYKSIPKLAEYIRESHLPIDRWKIYEFIRDKFRSDLNHVKYEMSEAEFEELCKMVPDRINNAEVILQSAHTERVGANCLIVYQNGDINLSGVHYGNVNVDKFDAIIDKLIADGTLDVISINKKNTYGEIK